MTASTKPLGLELHLAHLLEPGRERVQARLVSHWEDAE